MKTIASLCILIGAWVYVTIVYAQNNSVDSPTIIYSSADTASGGKNVFIVSQPANSPNPLGNPIVVAPSKAPQVYVPATIKQPSTIDNNNVAPSLNDTDLPQESLELGKDFQNTLVEGNGRIYDIQSYPTQDIKVIGNSADPQTIYSPNVNN